MTKSVEDYRNIVKVLKLQLLKLRQENNTISHSLGVTSDHQTSSFTPRINQSKQSKQPFAKNILLLTNFAHRCELIGITPQMVFRIADKKRDKKVSVNSMIQIMKRLKLKLDEVQINQLCTLLTKSGQLHYQQYLQYLSAFQINSEKYPEKSQRSYTQICLLRFGQECQGKGIANEQLYKIINTNERPALILEDFSTFVLRNNFKLKQIEVVGVFIGLDIQGNCQVEKQVFRREMGKIYSLIERGVKEEEEQEEQEEEDERNKNKKGQKKPIKKDEDEDYGVDIDTGVENINKATGQKKAGKKPQDTKLEKGQFGKVLNQLKKDNIRVDALISKLLDSQQKKDLIKSFSLLDFQLAIKNMNPDFNKKKILQLFKYLDTGINGSVSSQQLLKLLLRSGELTGSNDAVIYRILYRHMRQTQFKDPLSKFSNLGYNSDDKLNEKMLKEIFFALDLSNQQIGKILFKVGDLKIDKFCQMLVNQGKKKAQKVFKPMDKADYNILNEAIKKITSKSKEGANFKKLIRIIEKDQKNKTTWDTIFNDEWKCFQYCLETAKGLTSYWRDHEFGPTKGDQHGYRSIIGNQSDIPPGLPDEQDISWLTFEEILLKQKRNNEDVLLMGKDIKTTDVVQGKLGDCWFVSSLSIIANDDTYVKGKDMKSCRRSPQLLSFGVHPLLFQYFAKYGMYVFKFFKQFKPVYVVVDDLFPVQNSSLELIFAKSPDIGLQWVAFVEKAYAKLHHTYSNLISGDISQGLNDLTNALPIKQTLNAQDNNGQLEKLFRLSRQRQLMGCSIAAPKGGGVQKPVQLEGERCGLFYGHAYSVSDMIHLSTRNEQFNLIRIRNPWGHGEWCLDWSEKPIDDDPSYNSLDKYMDDITKYYQKRIKEAQKNRQQPPQMYKRGDDGQFLMNFNDWIKVFTNLFTGLLFKNSQYFCQYIYQKWDTKAPSGICKMKGSTQLEQREFIKNNHQYILQIKNQTDVLMLVIQEDGRLYRGQKYPYKQLCNAVIILVFRLEKNQGQVDSFNKEKLVSSNLKLELRRDVDFWRKLEPGRYAIIPCKMKNQIEQSTFQFRIYSSQDINIKKIKTGNQSFKTLPNTPKSNIQPSSINSLMDVLQKVASKQ